MSTQLDTVARATVAKGLRTWQHARPPNSAWIPARRAFLETLVRIAQLELAKEPPLNEAEKQRRAPDYQD